MITARVCTYDDRARYNELEGELHFQVRTRTVMHTVPARSVTRQYTVYRAWCPA